MRVSAMQALATGGMIHYCPKIMNKEYAQSVGEN